MIDFFIIGNPRSGTTLLRLILSSHSKLIVPPEAGFAVWLYENWVGEYNNELYVSRLLETKKIETWNISGVELLEFLYKSNVSNLKDAILMTYDFFRNMTKSSFIGDKNNYYLHHIESLKKISPGARYIHLVRDGRDVACSYIDIMRRKIEYKYAPKFSIEIDSIAEEWSENNKKIIDDLKGEDVFFVKLEDIQENPQENISKICDFLGVSFESSMLRFYEEERNFEPKEYDSWKFKNKKPISNDSGRYKKELSKEEVVFFEEIAGDLLKEYGYIK